MVYERASKKTNLPRVKPEGSPWHRDELRLTRLRRSLARFAGNGNTFATRMEVYRPSEMNVGVRSVEPLHRVDPDVVECDAQMMLSVEALQGDLARTLHADVAHHDRGERRRLVGS